MRCKETDITSLVVMSRDIFFSVLLLIQTFIYFCVYDSMLMAATIQSHFFLFFFLLFSPHLNGKICCHLYLTYYFSSSFLKLIPEKVQVKKNWQR